MNTTGTAEHRPTFDPGLVPEHIRSDIGYTLHRRFMEAIRDPEKLRLYKELGNAFMKRREEKGATT